ncbi:MAG: UDP-N-acetylmuramoyl-tripeptide--D-alanyl-D-alanine ligase [Betaproteobacteria bacterium]|nr:UDP-N-acetylmuramoyl-tripeptide--D-alanyl-D-alanine ligase [Betaproteobacteria bacterium]
MDLAFFARAGGGVLVGPNREVRAVSTDSRKLPPQALFVAIPGERFDGHDFVAAAFAQGAAGAMVSTERAQGLPLPRVVVADTLPALAQCAEAWRAQFKLPVIAITGSNGKTTVKEMLATIGRAAFGAEDAVLATEGNFNNHIGLPLSLLRLRETHRFAVIEIGMNHPGEIRELARITQPTVALVTNAQRAHLEGLGSVEAVARAKGEIFEGLGPEGVGVINADDVFASLWRANLGVRPFLTFGLGAGAEVRGVFSAATQGKGHTLHTPAGSTTLRLQVTGEHNLRNALAATAAALAAGIGLAAVVEGLEAFRGVPGRLQELPGPNGALLINDCYNANPDSVSAAIAVLAQRPGQRLLVLGDMGELGAQTAALHETVLRAAKEQGIDRVFVLGEHMGRALAAVGNSGAAFPNAEALARAVRGACDAHSTVLVKGSRFMRMERVVAALSSATMEAH